ncbi:hypothetical protein CI109_107108 [Kwoniella shandongensis]|uniref:cellulase n=1 Tax=Kwoniella shandongensis TaxID=1734106 RepID=A0A5M6C322_9TREE|nr:uncharacterized protein CI109_002391 [Kwoniella shandongensis]KAA5529050.1 hypothetical protein CI109_002391 [Kwoniella shandongensis]
MLVKQLIGVLALLATGLAAPLHQYNKRALPRLGGVNLAGCDFGMNTDGSSGTTYCPGTEQIAHFVKDGANVFRLPVGWQYLVGNNEASTSLDSTFFATYDNLVQSVLSQGAYAMIDIHNYARWNGQIIGQGGPSNDDFANVWSQLAKKYANDDKVIFAIMNEPHDLDINEWATTVQAAVNAIRAAGATTQTIALPGTGYTGVDTWSSGASDALLKITDPADSSNSLLVIDAHKYLDGNGSGADSECTNNGVDSATQFAAWLKKNGRKAIISETGGGNTASCQTNLNQYLQYLSTNTDVFVGFTIWAAGSFATDYTLSITPNGDTDNDLFVKAVKPYLPGASGADPAASSSVVSSAASSSASTASASSSSAKVISTADATSTVPSSVVTSSKAVDSSSLPVLIETSATDSAPVPVASDAVTSASSSAVVTSVASSESVSSASVTASAGEPTVTVTDDESCTEYTDEPSSASATATASITSIAVAPTGTATSSASAIVESSSAVVSSAAVSASDFISSSAVSASATTDVASSAAAVTSVTASASASAAVPSTTGSVSGGLQAYTGALGGIPAPAVSASGDKWTTGGQTYNFLVDALNASCYAQMNSCQLAANQGGNNGTLTVSACETQQIQACLSAASSASSSASLSASASASAAA